MQRREFVVSAATGLLTASPFVKAAFLDPPEAAASKIQALKPPDKGLIQVACAISKGTTEIDYIGPCAAFETWYEDPITKKPAPRFKIFTVSDTREPVDGRIADYTFETCPGPNIVIVPAQRGSQALLDWLKKVEPGADIVMSVCVGAAHLAKAGLLKGRRATSHHEAIDHLMKNFPDVDWVRGVRFVEGGKISTGGGLTAGIDLALHVIERYFGRDAARGVAEHLEYEGKGWMV